MNKKLLISALILLLFARMTTAADEDQVPFSPTLPAKSHCEIDVTALRPTQFALGMKEVQLRADMLSNKSPKALAKYLNKHIAPVVIGPDGVPYLIDGQHLARALQVAGIKRPLQVEIEANLADLSVTNFWDKMKTEHWVYLYDENGKGPLPPTSLPRSIAAMHDDPYRTLAWLVRLRYGYQKTLDESADFQWANFFRTRIPFENTKANDEKVLSNAVALARSPAAHELPGYAAASAKSTPAKAADPETPKPAATKTDAP